MDHTSPSGPGLVSMKASGAAKSGVRHSRVTVGSCPSRWTEAMPKSESRGEPEESRRILAGLTSRCMTPAV